jgi:hypothetical protein
MQPTRGIGAIFGRCGLLMSAQFRATFRARLMHPFGGEAIMFRA